MDSQLCGLPPDLVVGKSAETAADLWHLPKSVFESIWRKATGRKVTVAVLDTGYTPHPDLPTPKAQRSFIRGEAVKDGNGHGCHCIGTSVGRNGIGVASEAELIVGKVLSNRGAGGNDGIAKAVDWAVDEGADVISLSIGGGGVYQPMVEALRRAIAKGVVINAAAGNSGFNGANSIDYPGKYLETLCCAAYQKSGRIAGFSSGGRQVDWACPGQDIISASHRGQGYVSMSGTSMATPFGAGLLALIIELQRREGYAGFTGVEAVRSFLEAYTEDAGEAGKDDRFGHGIPKSSEIVASLAADDVQMLSTGAGL